MATNKIIKRLGHLALNVSDMDQSLQFYCDVLGLTRAFDLEDNNGNPWIIYLRVSGLQFIELFYGGQNRPEPAQKPIGFSHLCLEVDDIQVIAEHLRNKGIKLDQEPSKGKDHNWQCWAKDPDGNRIEFMQLSPDSPQMKTLPTSE